MATEKNAVDIKTSVEVPVEAKQFASCMGTAHAITGAWGFVGRSQKFGKVEIETFNIMTTRMFRDIDQGKWRKFVQYQTLNMEKDKPETGVWEAVGFPLELTGAAAFAPSPAGDRLAVLREEGPPAAAAAAASNGGGGGGKKTWVVDVYEGGRLAHKWALGGPGGELHGAPCGDGWFGGLRWAADGRHLVYVAERKPPKAKSWFARADDAKAKAATATAAGPAPGEEAAAAAAAEGEGEEGQTGAAAAAAAAAEAARRGEEYAWREDWGEKYVGTVDLGLYLLSLTTGRSREIKGCPPDATVGSPVFSPDGTHVVYTAWSNLPAKLGMIYCYQRPCQLWAVRVDDILDDLDKEEEEGAREEEKEKEGEDAAAAPPPPPHALLTPGARLSRTPRFSPDGALLSYMTNEEGFDTHGGAFRLALMDWAAWGGAAELMKHRGINANTRLCCQKCNPGFSSLGWVVLGEDSTKSIRGAAPPTSRTLVDVVDSPENVEDFPGLWADDFPESCWAPDSSSLFLTSAWRSSLAVLRVDARTGAVARLEGWAAAAAGGSRLASAALLNVAPFGALFTASSPSDPGGLGVAFHRKGAGGAGGFLADEATVHLGPAAGSVASLQFPHTAECKLSSTATAELKKNIQGIRWEVLNLVPYGGGAPFDALLLLPPEGGDQALPPLIVTPHGGPHGVCATGFVPAYAFLVAAQGYALLLVNYRGSVGFGQGPLNSLPGKCGTQDVADVAQATRAVLGRPQPVVDAGRVAVVGGSHGGFLAGHMVGQHPDLYKAAVMRNPVTNIASMVGVTDIRDWCFVEALGIGSYDFDSYPICTPEMMARMFAASPIAHAHNVRAPTLLCVGAKDRRVPCSQSVEFYNVLKAQGVKTKMLWYPEDVHAIDIVKSDADEWTNIVAWLNEHV